MAPGDRICSTVIGNTYTKKIPSIPVGKGKFERVSKASPSIWGGLHRAVLALQPGDAENSVKQIIRKH